MPNNVRNRSVAHTVKYREEYRKRSGGKNKYNFDLWKLCYELYEGLAPGNNNKITPHSYRDIYFYLLTNQSQINGLLPNGVPSIQRIANRVRHFTKNVVIH